ncbi:MAG: GDSL-type esterase/lipase family protein [Actinomycetota bacterium]|nr:GDSL-type esterase/lipase family protein [Actinomycetota bacterium]
MAALALGACDSDKKAPAPEPPSESAHPGTRLDANRVAALGDSITAGSPLYDPDPALRAALGFGDDERSQYEFWARRAEPELEFENCGVFGERTDEIAARLGECAAGAGSVIVQGGINDIAQSLGAGDPAVSSAVDDAAQNLDALVARAQAEGLEVAIANVLPWNNGHPGADSAIANLNRLIKVIAKRRAIPVLDFNRALEDPMAPGLMASRFTDDGDHPSIEGYRVLGELVAKVLR